MVDLRAGRQAAVARLAAEAEVVPESHGETEEAERLRDTHVDDLLRAYACMHACAEMVWLTKIRRGRPDASGSGAAKRREGGTQRQ